MNNILKSIKLDLYILKSYNKMIIYYFFIGALIGFVDKNFGLMPAIVIFVSAPFSGTYYSVYEKNNLGKLYGVLPIKKTDFVIGRYMGSLLIVMFTGILSYVLANILAHLTNIPVTNLTLATAVNIGFFLFCLYTALMLPLYSRFPFSKIYVVSTLPFFLLIPISLLIYQKTTLKNHLNTIFHFYTTHSLMIWVTGIGAGLVLILISLPISLKLYKNREM